jgi:hypothetical protein
VVHFALQHVHELLQLPDLKLVVSAITDARSIVHACTLNRTCMHTQSHMHAYSIAHPRTLNRTSMHTVTLCGMLTKEAIYMLEAARSCVRMLHVSIHEKFYNALVCMCV